MISLSLKFGKRLIPLGMVGLYLLMAAVAVGQDADPTEGTNTTSAAVSPGLVASSTSPELQAEVSKLVAEELKKAKLNEVSEMYLYQDGEESKSTIYRDADTLWTCLAAFLVFFMQAGFTLVECGFTRAKNACNIVMKNVMDFSIGTFLFWTIGFGLMFGTKAGGWIGIDTFAWDMSTFGASDYAFLLFQTVFCATAATIVSGAMAERTKFVGYLCYSIMITVVVYPIFGGWAWGGLRGNAGILEGDGMLGQLIGAGFNDYAGSTVVHSIGGWCALAGAIVIGPRIGKFDKDGKVRPIPGHNIPIAALGVFILWMGWFGFNAGSTTAIGDGEFAKIAFVTSLAASMGALSAMIMSWIQFKKPDPSFTLNGALAGLVAITAGCYDLSPLSAALVGALGGVVVIYSVMLFDKLKIDDPVGAVSVHGVCGVLGTLAVGLLHPTAGLFFGGGAAQFLIQLVGVLIAFAWAFPVSLVIFLGVKYTVGLRVSEQEELEGLDITEHGMHAYPPSLINDGLTSPSLAYGAAPSAKPSVKPATQS